VIVVFLRRAQIYFLFLTYLLTYLLTYFSNMLADREFSELLQVGRLIQICFTAAARLRRDCLFPILSSLLYSKRNCVICKTK